MGPVSVQRPRENLQIGVTVNAYTYRQAAKRVGRAVITIKRWRRHGMPMGYDKHGRRIVEEAVLLAFYRSKLLADPIHQQKLRKIFGEELDT